MPAAATRSFSAGRSRPFSTTSDRVAGDVVQLGGGRAYVVPAGVPITAGSPAFQPYEEGWFQSVAKAAGIVLLDGDEVFWDYTNNHVTFKRADGQSFLCGVLVGDAGSGATRCAVDWNKRASWAIDALAPDPGFASVIVGTQSLGGLGIYCRGGQKLVLGTTNEAQKVDLLSKASMTVGSHPIIEFAFTVNNGSSGAAPDFSIGVANATHATDADSITEHLLLHVDGNSGVMKLQAKDGTNTLAATTTGRSYVAGTRVEGKIDLRDPSSAKVYLDGIRVLSSTTIDVSNAVGPWKLLAHLEKTSAADVYDVDIERLRARTQNQAA